MAIPAHGVGHRGVLEPRGRRQARFQLSDVYEWLEHRAGRALGLYRAIERACTAPGSLDSRDGLFGSMVKDVDLAEAKEEITDHIGSRSHCLYRPFRPPREAYAAWALTLRADMTADVKPPRVPITPL